MKTIPLSEVERIVREAGERIISQLEEEYGRVQRSSHNVGARAAYRNAISIIRSEFELPVMKSPPLTKDMLAEVLEAGPCKVRDHFYEGCRVPREMIVQQNRHHGKEAQAQLDQLFSDAERTPRYADPCPHPERRGQHEWYIDDLVHKTYVCRACGATATRAQLVAAPRSALYNGKGDE